MFAQRSLDPSTTLLMGLFLQPGNERRSAHARPSRGLADAQASMLDLNGLEEFFWLLPASLQISPDPRVLR